MYRCLCDCGNYVDVYAANLRKRNTMSCGCLNSEKISERRLIDLSGKRFGMLQVICRVEDQIHGGGSRSAMWLCRCDCGNEVVINGGSLRRGLTKSCGCNTRKAISDKLSYNLAGQRFGRLIALNSKRFVFPSGRTIIKWYCKCDCGGYCWVSTHSLVSGYTRSCGCLLSAGEESVGIEISKYNVTFSKQYSFKDLKGPRGGFLFFDFALYDDHNNLLGLIEYQGKQHYVPQTNSDFGKYQRDYTDDLKRQYCKEHNIMLFEISYLEDIPTAIKSIINALYGNLVPSLGDEEGVTTISQEST